MYVGEILIKNAIVLFLVYNLTPTDLAVHV